MSFKAPGAPRSVAKKKPRLEIVVLSQKTPSDGSSRTGGRIDSGSFTIRFPHGPEVCFCGCGNCGSSGWVWVVLDHWVKMGDIKTFQFFVILL